MSSLLKEIADRQLLNSFYYSNLGLLEGKAGVALFFFLYARYTNNSRYEDFAGELLDNVCNNLHTGIPINFVEGLCGIGWGIEFMKREGFIEGDTDEILEEVDRVVMERDLERISDTGFELGLEGIVMYVRSRLDSFRDVCGKPPFDFEYLTDMDTVCCKNGICWRTGVYSMDAVWSRILNYFSSSPYMGKDGWKKGITMIKQKNG